MRINPLNHINNQYQRNQIERQEQSDSVKKRDQLEISKAAKEMQQGSRIEQEREMRVKELKEQVDNGSYKVDAHAVARKFYDYWNEV